MTNNIADQPKANRKTDIEDLPEDVMRPIMVHVAKQPNSGFDIYNSFFICKKFQEVTSNDEDILKTVDFDNWSSYCIIYSDPSSKIQWDKCGSPDLSSQFETFYQIGGFVHRAAAVGNPSAQMILSKLIIKSASKVFRGRRKPSKICAKASNFLSHFTAQKSGASTTGKLLHYELVNKLIKQASISELRSMKPYLADYLSYFRDPAVGSSAVTRQNEFISLLNELIDDFNTAIQSAAIERFAKVFKEVCKKVRTIMLSFGVNLEIRHAQKLAFVKEEEYFEKDYLRSRFERLDGFIWKVFNEAKAQIGSLQQDDPRQDEIVWIAHTLVQIMSSLIKQTSMLHAIQQHHANMIAAFQRIFSI